MNDYRTKKTASEMNRKEFIKLTSTGILAASMIHPVSLFTASDDPKKHAKTISKEVRKDLFKVACSGALFLALNRHFGYPQENKAFAVASLSGGIMQEGYQCGMLWGSTLAAGAESFRRYTDSGLAIGKSIITTQNLLESFQKRTKCINCRDITRCEWSNKGSILKYMITGKMFKCLNIVRNWAPEAIQSAEEGLRDNNQKTHEICLSCASEVARKMGASDEEIVMVSGFAGGMGLSGNACGALGAAIWMKSLNCLKKHPESRDMYNTDAKTTLNKFYKTTNSEMLCYKICGRQFQTVDEHTEFVKNGGCARLIEVLVQS